jgi:hypothetical protein
MGGSSDPGALAHAVLSWGGAVVCAAVATAALTYAILIPAKAPDWFRDHFGLEHGDETATTPWVRWTLLIVALVALLLPRIWGRPVWPEVAVASLIAIVVVAVVKQHDVADKPKATTPGPAMTFSLPEGVPVLGSVNVGTKIVVLLVGPKKVSGKTVTAYESRRFEAKRVTCKATPQATSVCVSVERGEKDANAVSFSAALASATQIYLEPSA